LMPALRPAATPWLVDSVISRALLNVFRTICTVSSSELLSTTTNSKSFVCCSSSSRKFSCKSLTRLRVRMIKLNFIEVVDTAREEPFHQVPRLPGSSSNTESLLLIQTALDLYFLTTSLATPSIFFSPLFSHSTRSEKRSTVPRSCVTYMMVFFSRIIFSNKAKHFF